MEYFIYGKPNCPYCEMAKTALTQNGKSFEYKSLNVDFTAEELIDTVIAKTGVRPTTFPQIFSNVDGVESYIGGYAQLTKHLQEQK